VAAVVVEYYPRQVSRDQLTVTAATQQVQMQRMPTAVGSSIVRDGSTRHPEV